MSVQPIPEGYHSVTPYLVVSGANEAIAWYQKAFEATEQLRLDGPGGSVAHAEIKIGDSIVMLADEHPRSAAILRYLAESYEREARRNEASAERFRRGLH